jgi:hypothetical protein
MHALTLSHAVLYGMVFTIGAGMQAPLAFVAAAILMGLSAASVAELGSRMPVAAGEAAYIRASPILVAARGCGHGCHRRVGHQGTGHVCGRSLRAIHR